MDFEPRQPDTMPETTDYFVPWKLWDNWIGVVLLVLVSAVMVFLVWQGGGAQFAQSAGIIFLELVYLVPVVSILAWRGIHPKHLGFRKFDWNTLGLGCGLLLAAYVAILLHNLALMALGVDTQGEAILKALAELDSPVWLFIVGIVVAPVVEEIFFRGFLFQGFRQQYGWVKSMLLSSVIFAFAHLDLASLIPTFILGGVLAYVYHKSNSVWPGILLHFLVNAFGLCSAYALTQFPGIIP
jgi:uncharacterized protein